MAKLPDSDYQAFARVVSQLGFEALMFVGWLAMVTIPLWLSFVWLDAGWIPGVITYAAIMTAFAGIGILLDKRKR